jgi:hypothetical protein
LLAGVPFFIVPRDLSTNSVAWHASPLHSRIWTTRDSDDSVEKRFTAESAKDAKKTKYRKAILLSKNYAKPWRSLCLGGANALFSKVSDIAATGPDTTR